MCRLITILASTIMLVSLYISLICIALVLSLVSIGIFVDGGIFFDGLILIAIVWYLLPVNLLSTIFHWYLLSFSKINRTLSLILGTIISQYIIVYSYTIISDILTTTPNSIIYRIITRDSRVISVIILAIFILISHIIFFVKFKRFILKSRQINLFKRI